MENITEKELSGIEDSLTMEQNLIAKYQMYASICADPQVKSKCEQLAAKHQNPFDKLLSCL